MAVNRTDGLEDFGIARLPSRWRRVIKGDFSGGDSGTRAGMPVTYPYQRRFFLWALWGLVLGSVLFRSVLAGFAFFVLLVLVGASWRKDEPPILPFCFGYQWVSIVIGFLYQARAGFYPGFYHLPDVATAVLISLLSLIVVLCGIRIGLYLSRLSFSKLFARNRHSGDTYDLRKIFWWVIFLYGANWIVEIVPTSVHFGSAQIIYRFLEYRVLFVFLLFSLIVKRRRGYQ